MAPVDFLIDSFLFEIKLEKGIFLTAINTVVARWLIVTLFGGSMDPPAQIILVSQTAELKIRFTNVLDVTNRKIALCSLHYPYASVEQQNRAKRLVKDSYAVGEMLTTIVMCDEIKENTIMNEINTSNAGLPLRCLDLIQLQTYREHNFIDFDTPIYHEFSANRLFGLTVRICDLNGDQIRFAGGSNIVVKLLIK